MKVNILLVVCLVGLAYTTNAACSDENCIYCPDYSTCKACRTGYGVISWYCRKCVDDNCSQCNGDISTCKICKTGYGVISWYCRNCVDDNCAQCNGDISTCKVCKTGYCLSSGYCRKCLLDIAESAILMMIFKSNEMIDLT
jgi:hypothetical protein